jgi:hypothetical protein
VSWEHGYPACWEWDHPLPDLPAPTIDPNLPPALRRIEEQAAAIMAGIRTPEDTARERLQLWHRGLCAVCGGRASRLLEDHDHRTGLTRGYLCGTCNVGEGVSRSPVFSLYRWRPPADLLGLTIRYVDVRTGRPVEPDPVGRRRREDRFANNATQGIGL